MRNYLTLVLLVILSSVVFPPAAVSAPPPRPDAPSHRSPRTSPYVWWEGESTVDTNFPARSDFSASTFESTRYQLSGGDWLSDSGPRHGDEAYARYRIEVPADGTYELWARKFWKHGPFRWRFGEGKWQVCGPDVALADSTDLQGPVCVNWVFLGTVKLSKGPQTFELRLLAKQGESLAAAFDCFVLSRGPFFPNGKLKPGARSGLADPGYFPFEPPADPFTSDALLDLRTLNERTAGEHGFVRREGGRFVLGNGKPVRFWGVDVGGENAAQARPSVDYLARRLAKLGVNMVRYHGPLFADGPDPARIDPKKLDDLFYLVAALKRQGIYTTLSFYFPLWFEVQPSYGIDGYDDAKSKIPFALLYFDPRMQEIHRAWARALLTTKNPYTGLTLARDPAVAIVEIVNEDSFFFWTFTKKNVPAVQWQRLETLYAGWLRRRYGTLEKALAAWGGARLPDDDAAAGRLGLYEAWDMTRDGVRAGGPDKRTRVGDQVRFLTELQRGFYQRTVRYLKHDLGYGGLVSASNWTVSDPATLDALERYTYTAGDVIDRHGYFGGKHEGPRAGYAVGVGDTFRSLAGVTVPERVPLQFAQVADYPQIMTEIGWTNPNRYRAEATFLTSAYSALQGVDGIYFFAVGSNYMRDGAMQKFAVSSPVIAGAFPAAALQYRRGDVREAREVVHEVLKLDDLYALKGSAIQSASALDALRQAEVPRDSKLSGRVQSVDPLACYVGPVTRSFGDHPEQSWQRPLTDFVDRDHKTIRSLTSQLFWDYGNGVVTVNTPRSQGAAGFLAKAGKLDLGDISIECRNEFASVMVISLDGQPLATSKRILIQAMTEEQPYGFRTEGDRITAMGGAPFGVKKVQARVSLRLQGAGKPKVTVLDENGYATAEPVRLWQSAGRVNFELAEDAIYDVVTR